MAFTWTYGDAWLASRGMYNRELDASKLEYATNLGINKFWTAYDWRGSVQKLPPFWIVSMQQDYGAPFYSVPSNFHGLRECYVVFVNTADSARSPLRDQNNIERTSMVAMPTRICYRPEIAGFRLWPCPPPGMTAPNWLIDGTYKIKPTKFNRSNLGDTLPLDDVYFNVIVQAFVWGALVASGQTKQALEQTAVFQQVLMESTGVENRESGEPSISPEESIAFPRSWGGFYY